MPSIFFIDDDENYVRVLEKKIVMELYKEVEVYTITNETYRKKYLGEFKNLDILIIDETLYDETILRHDVSYTIILERNKNINEREKTEKKLHIYKYQSVKEIFERIYHFIASYLGIEGRVEGKAEVICIYSPIGGSGKTTISLGIANILGKKEKKVLYVNWETIQSYKEAFETNKYLEEKTIYKIKNKRFDELSKKELVEKQRYYDYLLPFQNIMHSWEIAEDEFLSFIGYIKKELCYDYIIIDNSSDFNYTKSRLFSKADKNIIIVEQSQNASYKMNSFFSHLDCSNNGKFKFLCNKYKEQEENYVKEISFFKYTGTISGYISWKAFLEIWREEELLQFSDLKREVFRLI